MRAYSASFSSHSAAVSSLMMVLAVATGAAMPAVSMVRCTVVVCHMFRVKYRKCVCNMIVGVV